VGETPVTAHLTNTRGSGSMPTPVRLTMDVSVGFLTFLDRLAADMDTDPAEVVRLSLGLMRIAVDARREGNRVAVVTPEDEVEQDIDGF
jgi:hypothetical protein